ncbi:MAG: 1-deoxy-D-xylulose-5-phosphate synthase [Arenicellales bacterium]|jgi:1-deoxy-D-xylulose-5-phosphate synthase|nr:1-deoxy-D-xylulose-5-phosphate synthase [Arenicellales bacterium]MDP7156125.1 1-deoxy-D-xylulose-5-phosphate synthase [Arenicellales bacterium]MDP7283384.1 1-deoxy-D-xylulose-5-phosphate synthase [Arenicellales bacterium]MDP7482194.1 1-deoxy-D-xylulose-5-phosphate synthase [Arenicellales bacterium]MDP7521829.1 1-deoxy-D-xylulose-5-phosphate synthase [Arenicellales bacterium]|tara:strand:- start:2184 stop:4097 length:1914 start_codon:yes stop_codon:yes gene_type:complete
MTNATLYPLLSQVNTPADLRELDESELPQLAEELRGFLIDVVSTTGGHLAAGLGTVELTIACHYVFDTPDDRLVWDIGHQAYPHKILTGRRDKMSTLRHKGGLSGFLQRSESPYDTFGAGHSSTSIGAGLGMAIAASLDGEERNSDREVVSIIGDGAMTAGMAFEALNNAGGLEADLLVILNDNDMSISPNVGAMSNYLARILSGRAYTSVREGSKQVLGTLPPVKHLARRWEEHLKGLVMPSTLFEELGFNYIGPIDGHNLSVLIKTLRNMRKMKRSGGPRFLHVITQKGRGFEPAEGDPCIYHGVSPFDPDTGKMEQLPEKITYTEVFSDWLCDIAEQDDRAIGITPAMREGSGLMAFAERFPDKYYDVGIAEQHALTFAAGLACEGYKPVIAIYSTFLQRGYDQLVHDVCLQGLDVTLAIDRGGIVGADGATHAGTFDLSFMRCIPDLVIMAPTDEDECRQMLYTGFTHPGPAAIRYPRGTGPGRIPTKEMTAIPIGKGEIVRRGERVAILVFGTLLIPALDAAKRLNATVANMRFVKPLDEDLVKQLAKSHDLIVTLEENVVAGGAGSGVNELFAASDPQQNRPRLLNLGIPDRFLDHGSQSEVLADCGLDPEGIYKSIHYSINHLAPSGQSK